jgi:choline monooxygenase
MQMRERFDATMDLFDPQNYRAVRKPLLDAETLPLACYTSPEFHRREVSEIFLKCWNLVGRVDYVKNPGDYFTHSIAGVSFIVMRGDDGRIRAFVNACRHRSAPLLEGEGNCRTIRCPYHGWLYDRDGSLRAAVGMQETHDFSAADGNLIEIKLDVWCGFLFVNFDPASGSLRDYLGGIDAWTESYDFETMVTAKRKEFVIRANWKSYVENSLDYMHLPTVHQQSIGGVRAVWEPVDGNPGNFVIMRSKTAASRATLGNDPAFAGLPPKARSTSSSIPARSSAPISTACGSSRCCLKGRAWCAMSPLSASPRRRSRDPISSGWCRATTSASMWSSARTTASPRNISPER